ncbi:MAG: isocitrate lyase/phosphoenolpyruvate mutase family protein [Pseudomonadota bacterium]
MTVLQIPETAEDAILAPGVYDALSALIAQRAGARAVYLSGASVSYTQLGRPDLGFADLTLIADVTRRITDRITIPVIVDADTGFGNALNVQRSVSILEKAGAAAIQLEDQAMPKRCGHLSGKSLISTSEMTGKIAAALDARASTKVKIIARTDAIGVEGLDAAFERAERYIEAGADCLFIEALRNEEEMRRACDRFGKRVPMIANMVEGGRTPLRTADVLAGIGFRLVICPGALARAFGFMAEEFLTLLVKEGASKSYSKRMLDFDTLNRLIGLPEMMEAGSDYDRDSKKAAE